MKCKKILKGLMVMGILVGLAAPVVTRADTGPEPDESRLVKIKALDDPSIISVDLEWGDLQYEFVYKGYGDGQWVSLPNENDIKGTSDYLKVANRSNFSLLADLRFRSLIDGVTSAFSLSEYKEGVGSCVDATDKIIYTSAWSQNQHNGPYEFKNDPMATVIYSDSNCQVQVADGATYDSTKSYYYVALDSEFIGATATADTVGQTIPGVDKNYSENVVGSQYDPTKLASIVKFQLELFGGNYETVKGVYNSNKSIGHLDVWLYPGD